MNDRTKKIIAVINDVGSVLPGTILACVGLMLMLTVKDIPFTTLTTRMLVVAGVLGGAILFFMGVILSLIGLQHWMILKRLARIEKTLEHIKSWEED